MTGWAEGGSWEEVTPERSRRSAEGVRPFREPGIIFSLDSPSQSLSSLPRFSDGFNPPFFLEEVSPPFSLWTLGSE